MSEIITAGNLELVVQKNFEIAEEISTQANELLADFRSLHLLSRPQLAMLLLREHGLVQMPVEDKYWGGAIFVKDGKRIPFLNTAQPRVNQNFTAWHEVYHLYFDKVSFDHFIENEGVLEERKADCFAGAMLLEGIGELFPILKEDFLTNVYTCMSIYQAPYKAVLISLFESAVKTGNLGQMQKIREVFDRSTDNLVEVFRKQGLDESLVLPSYVVNASHLQEKIQKRMGEEPELRFHEDNAAFLTEVLEEAHMLSGRGHAEY